MTTAREISQFWDKAKIPTYKECHIIGKNQILHSAWQNLKKNAARKGNAQRKKDAAFVGMLDDLIDVAHADALILLKIAEDREFLIAQREKGRSGNMSSTDTTLAKQEQRRQIRETQKRKRQEKDAERSMTKSADVMWSDILSSTEESDNSSGEAKGNVFVSEPSFNAVLTSQEEQKQYLLQVIEKHRQEYPDSNKCTLVGCGMPDNMQ